MIFPREPETRSRWLGRRYLFRIGRRRIPSYSAFQYVGCVLGVALGARVAAASGLDRTRFALAAVALVIPALAGGRLWFLLERPGRLVTDPGRFLRTGEGGAGLYGGLALSVLVSPLVLVPARLEFWRFWDAAAVVLLVGMLVTRFGCLMNGCCCGREAGRPWGVWLPDHAGVWRRRWPTQLLEAGWSALLLSATLAAAERAPFPGALFLGAAAGYALGRLVLERLRESAARDAVSTRMNLAFSALLLGAAVLGLVLRS